MRNDCLLCNGINRETKRPDGGYPGGMADGSDSAVECVDRDKAV